MAKRKGIRRVDSSEVMGEGSYVKVRPVPYARSREIIAMKDRDDVTVQEQETFVSQVVVDSLVAWDWVDDDGDTLPIPKAVDEMSEMLYNHEVEFLLKTLLPTEERAKN